MSDDTKDEELSSEGWQELLFGDKPSLEETRRRLSILVETVKMRDLQWHDGGDPMRRGDPR